MPATFGRAICVWGGAMNKPINSDDAQYSRSDVDTIGAHRQSSATGIRYADAPGTIRVSATQSLESAATLWRVFERRAISTPFQTFAWLEAWQSHIGSAQGVTPHIVFGHDQSDGLCLIMPLAISLRRGVRTLSWLGRRPRRTAGSDCQAGDNFPDKPGGSGAVLASSARERRRH